MSKHWSQVVALEDNDSRGDPANMICEAEPGSTPGQDRDGTAQASCFDWLYFWWRKEAMSKRRVTYVKDWHLRVASVPLWWLQRALNDWFSVDVYPFCGFKVQGMNPALWAKRDIEEICVFLRAAQMEKEMVDFRAILPEMCKAAKIQNLFGNPQPSIT